MWNSILNLLSGLPGAVGEFFKYQTKKLELRNAPKIQAALESAQDQRERDRINALIQRAADGDLKALNELRKLNNL